MQATGPCGVALQLASRTDAQIIGIDLGADMLGKGAGNVHAAGLDGRISLVLGRPVFNAVGIVLEDGSREPLTATTLLAQLESALLAFAGSVTALATALVVFHSR